MELGGYRSYFGTGSDLMYSVESENFTRHLCILDDVKRAARVCDALTNIDFIMSCAHPSDISPSQSYLFSFLTMTEHSTKPIVCTAECRDDLSEMWEIARVLRGSEEVLIEKPYFIHYAEPTSPLKHPPHSLEKLLFCAEKQIPVIYSPAPLAGSTAPMTIAGHVAQGLAESFCGLVIHQLKAEGAPFLMGMGAAILDMATSQSSYNAPEYYMAYLAMIEMSHYFDLPSWGYAGTSDSQIPDGQATFEAGLLTFMATMAGANLNHDVGYLNFGLTGSLEMVVILDEVIAMIRRMKQGIPVTEETLALDAIREVGYTGHHLIHPHTLKHLRNTQWRPKLINRKGYEQWEKEGGLTFLERARKTLHDILEKHKPVAIPEEKLQEIRRRVEQFKR
jgi:trimethylamine--corrinoid protein Co-methyltransferase